MGERGHMRIGDLAARTGASVRSLRYYEQQGLLRARRSPRAQRVYDEDAVDRVRLLKRLYGAGLTSAVIATLLPCVDAPSEQTTRATIAVMRRERDRIGEQIAQLAATREQLSSLIEIASSFHDEQLGGPAVAS